LQSNRGSSSVDLSARRSRLLSCDAIMTAKAEGAQMKSAKQTEPHPRIASLGGVTTNTSSGSSALEIATRALVEIARAARAAWPEVELSLEAFLSYLAIRLPADQPVEDARSKIFATDLFLACACAHGSAAAIEIFERRYMSVIDGALRTTHRDAEIISEVKQRIRHRVLVGEPEPSRPAICGYTGRGPLRSWLRVMAVREAIRIDQHARREVPLDDDAPLQAISGQNDPEFDALKRRYRAEFKQAFDAALGTLSDRDRIILRQHFMDGLTIDQLGRLHGVHRATAARHLKRAEERLLARTRQAFQVRINVTRVEFESILRLIWSRLEVSLGGLMKRRRRS
jgi:RNA polymerase sigma-70 factor, ECF subfamily